MSPVASGVTALQIPAEHSRMKTGRTTQYQAIVDLLRAPKEGSPPWRVPVRGREYGELELSWDPQCFQDNVELWSTKTSWLPTPRSRGRTLRDQFDRSMRARLPQFSPQRAPWGKVFRFSNTPGPHFFVQMYTDRNDDVFQVEAGWAADERAFVARQLIRNREAIDVRLDGSRFVLGCLWDEKDPMYVFGVGRPPTSALPWTPKSEAELLPVASEKAIFAVQRLFDYAVPIFTDVARSHGHDANIQVGPETRAALAGKN